MRRLLLLLTCLGAAGSMTRAATPVYVTPDVPTTENLGGTTLLPWKVYRYDAIGYVPVLTVPGSPTIDAIHKMDSPGDWLLSVEATSNFSGSLTADAEPRDVIRYHGATGIYSTFFCGGALGIPAWSNVDGLYLEGGDAGNLIVSFDVPTDLPPFSTFEPSDFVRFLPAGGPLCSDWALAAANPAFDASAAGAGVSLSTNAIGADDGTGMIIFSVDVPTDLAPPGPVTYLPASLVSWNGATFSIFETLSGWPGGSLVNGISCASNPGRLPIRPSSAQMVVSKSGGSIVLDWSASCSDAEDYGIYEGTIGSWYGHTRVDCSDDGSDLVERVTPTTGRNHYYLVVPHSFKEEGSYGANSAGVERPAGAAVCAPAQNLTRCPPDVQTPSGRMIHSP